MTTIRIATAAAAILLTLPLAAEAKTGVLDGMRFEVEIFGENGAHETYDEFVFASGMLTTQRLHDLGCTLTGYAAKRLETNAMSFEARFEIPEGGIVHVKGIVRDDSIEGSMTWPEEGGEPSSSRFVGRRVRGQLDGMQFDIEFVREDELEEEPDWEDEETEEPVIALEESVDRVRFDGGTFTSRACAEHGFVLSSFTDDKNEGRVSFRASTSSDSHGFMEWTGDVEEETIEGSLSWMRPDGYIVRYSFKGRRVLG